MSASPHPDSLTAFMDRAHVSRHQLAAAAGRVWQTVRNWEQRAFAPDPVGLRTVKELCHMTDAELGRLVLWFAGHLPPIPRASTVCGVPVGHDTCGKPLDHAGRHKGGEALATRARRDAAHELRAARLDLAELRADIEARTAPLNPKFDPRWIAERFIDPIRIGEAPAPMQARRATR